MNTDDILFNEKPAQSGLIGEVILNRPHVLNSLSLDMCQRFARQLYQWEINDDISAVIVKGMGDRAFCTGGDIRAIYENREKNPKSMGSFFWHEYRLNAFIHHFPKPYFALLHNITMGGGGGISIHGTYRIATENLRFAMPETKIGFYPDVGASYFLNQCPGYTGLYLGLTGNTINATAAHELGLVTHRIPQRSIEAFEAALYQADHITSQLMEPFTIKTVDSQLTEHINIINDCFSKESTNDIYQHLYEKNDWARNIVQQLKSRCPNSLKITFEAYHRAKTMLFDDIMQMDFDLSQQCLLEPDFFEGIRAAIIDKDQSPTWQPLMPDTAMEKYFEFKGVRLF